MKYRRLGSSGLTVSVVGLGTNNFGQRIDYNQTEAVIKQAIDAGINFFDTSNTYGEGRSEEFIGKALKGSRDKVLLASKVANAVSEAPNQHGTSRKHILAQVEVSLKRLQTDYLDLYQLHFYDPNTPLEETLRTLDDLVRQGKVRYLGCCNFAAWQVAQAMGAARMLNLEPFVGVETEYNMLKRGIEKELFPCVQRYRLGILPYYPLASGFLTGKYKRGDEAPDDTRLGFFRKRADVTLTDENFAVLAQLEAFAAQRGRSLTELAVAWLLAHPEISSVIAGVSKPEQVATNIKGIDWQLTPADMEELDGVLQALAHMWHVATPHMRPFKPS
jgi:aryl-alcohol dehydrogenase-like predicted oxidoreductase